MIPVEHWNSVPYNKNSHCCRYIECAIKIRMWMLFLSFFVPFGIGNFSPTMEALTQCQLRCERIFANIRILVPSFDNVSTNFYSTISARRLTSWTNVQFYGNNTSFLSRRLFTATRICSYLLLYIYIVHSCVLPIITMFIINDDDYIRSINIETM